MNRNAVIWAIEYALKDEGCNEIPVAMLFDRVRKTRGNVDLRFGDKPGLTEGSLVGCSQQHPSVPLGNTIRL